MVTVETAEGRRAASVHTSRRSRSPGLPPWAVGLVVVVGLGLRLWLLRSPLGVLDSDEAVGGLIARHFLDGEITVFLWGNAWGGTLEAIVTAGLFAVVGSSVFTLKLVMVGFYAGGCYLTWRVGRRLVDEGAARFAAALLWLFPSSLVLLSIKARLYYGAAMVIALGVVLMALRLKDRPKRSDVIILGFLLGLGVWTAPFTFYIAIPTGIWLLWRNPALWRRAPLAVPGLLVGAMPWIAFNVRNGFPSLSEPDIPVDSSYLERLAGFFTRLVPSLLGLRLNVTGDWVLGLAGPLLYLAVLAGAAALTWKAVRHRSRLVPLVVIAAGFPFVFAIPASSFYVSEPRYGLVLAPVVALLVAAGVWRWVTPLPAQLAVLGAATLATVAGTLALVDFTEGAPRHHDVAAAPLAPLVDELQDHDVDTLYADYWISYRLSFVTEEAILASPIDAVRYEPYDKAVRAAAQRADETTFVVHEGAPKDDALQETLETEGLEYQRTTPGRFAVYYVDDYVPTDVLDEVKFLP